MRDVTGLHYYTFEALRNGQTVKVIVVTAADDNKAEEQANWN